MLPHRYLLLIPLVALALGATVSTSHAAPAKRVPACQKVASPAQATLAKHNKENNA